MNDWMDKIKKELNKESEAEKFVKENLPTFFKQFTEIARSEAEKVNAEFFDNQDFCRVETNSKALSFTVIIADDEKQAALNVSFTPNKFIEVRRRLKNLGSGDEYLPEVIAIRHSPNGYKITYEPKHFDGESNTDQIGEKTLAKLLIEPVVRKYFNLPQESYKKGLGR